MVGSYRVDKLVLSRNVEGILGTRCLNSWWSRFSLNIKIMRTGQIFANLTQKHLFIDLLFLQVDLVVQNLPNIKNKKIQITSLEKGQIIFSKLYNITIFYLIFMNQTSEIQTHGSSIAIIYTKLCLTVFPVYPLSPGGPWIDRHKQQ